VETTGFSTTEIDVLFEAPATQAETADPDNDIPAIDLGTPPVSRLGDLWLLNKHRLLCGSSLEESSYQLLLGDELAELICADPPYNLGIAGNVSGLGKVQHGEFAMASGEMKVEEFSDFLTKAFELGARFSVDGSIHFQFMDWRHMREMLCAGYRVFSELKALCIWNKGSGGMGSLYRSQHELVFVWKNGRSPHINNVELGKNGRYRTNVWDVRGMNSFHRERDEQLAIHPTIKPVGLIADAIRDCSRVGGLVLDAFGGSGTTILAAERARRRAALIEIDPRYVDVAIRRWETKTGGQAVLASSGHTFAEVASERAALCDPASRSERSHD
jgi:DNA modification methylase